jgi:pimeloyl-ACP methyl ester carboxylesterase
MGREKGRPSGYVPFLEFYLRRKEEGGKLLVPGVFRGTLSAIARRSCLVLVHGFNNTDSDAARAYFGFRQRQVEAFRPPDPWDFDRYFGDAFWPGDADWWSVFDKADFLVYPAAVRTGIRAAREIASLLSQMPNLERVDFIAHSLGCRVALETLLLLRERPRPVVGRVCLMAAAVPSEMLEPGGRFYDLLRELALEGTRIHVLHSKQDDVLHLAFPPGQALVGGIEASTRALGRAGPTPAMPGFRATLTEQPIARAEHSDYWGHTKTAASIEATTEAGTFLALGAVSREVSVRRALGVPAKPPPLRELGSARELAAAG